MRSVQILLILILCICICWMGALLFGPWAINKVIAAKTQGNVVLVGAKVTPQLKIMAQKIEIDRPSGRVVLLRGAEVGWSISLRRSPKLIVNVAKGFVGQLQTIENLQLSISMSDGDYPVILNGSVEKLGGFPNEVAKTVEFEGKTTWDFNILRDIKLEADAFSLHGPLRATVNDVSVFMQNLSIGADIIDNDFKGHLTFGATEFTDLKFKLSDVDVKFSGKLDYMTAEYKTGRVTLADYGATAEKTSGTAVYNILENHLLTPTTIVVDQLSSAMLNVPEALINLAYKEKKRLVSGSGKINFPELILGGQYVASVPELAFTLKTAEKLLVDSRIFAGEIYLVNADEQVVVTTDFDVAIDGNNELLNCFADKCMPTRLLVNYGLQVNEELLSGQVECKGTSCEEGIDYSIRTSDTHTFFSNLQALRWVSPLFLATAYAQMLGGKKNGDGNEINF